MFPPRLDGPSDSNSAANAVGSILPTAASARSNASTILGSADRPVDGRSRAWTPSATPSQYAQAGHALGGHSGIAGAGDLSEKLIAARSALNEIFAQHLTLKSPDGWQSQAKFPFINVGTPGVYNVTAGEGILGVEIRPIPQDDAIGLRSTVYRLAQKLAVQKQNYGQQRFSRGEIQAPHIPLRRAGCRRSAHQID